MIILFKHIALRSSIGLLTLICVTFCGSFTCAQNIPLLNAFAHNDYQHRQPLFEALDNGYTYIEADVYDYHNRLIITHVLPQIHHKRTLEALYLEPLANHIGKNNGEVYSGYKGPVTLMIDIKSDPAKTYALLKPLLEKYRSILSGYRNGVYQEKQVRIVLSGHKPAGLLAQDTDRLAFMDEDLRRINRDTTTARSESIFAMASCKYSKMLKWKGSGLFSSRERNKLADYTALAHRCGAKVRLWDSPDNERVWQQLLNCGVDLINTDKLARLKKFLVSDGIAVSTAASVN